MKKLLILTCIIFIAIALFSSTAFSWGPATHAYIGNKLGNKFGYLNLQEMYGAMAPDIPWIMFDPEDVNIRNVFGGLTHYQFERVADSAWWRSQKSFAYGFVTHNEDWGADYTAHMQTITLTPSLEFLQSGLPPGYVIIKAWELEPMLFEVWEKLEIGGASNYSLRLEICHIAVEGAVDLLLVNDEIDKDIGMRMVLSALFRSPSVPWLLVRAYAGSLADDPNLDVGSWWESAQIIIATEKEFRQLIVLYGLGLSQEDPVAAVAEIVATQFGHLIDLPSGINLEQLNLLSRQVLTAAISLCASSYFDELNETIEAISSELD